MHFGTVHDFQGLDFTSDVRSESNIAAVVGRNGAGKTRLLKAISEGRIEVFVNDSVVRSGAVRLLTLNELQPSLIFTFDLERHREQQRQAVAAYNSLKGKFDIDPQRSMAAIANPLVRYKVNPHQIALTVTRASRDLRKDVNDLEDIDIEDYFSEMDFMPIGQLNVVEAMRAYLEREERNDYLEYRNHRHGEHHRIFNDREFRARFGPPPWDLLNDVLKTVFDGRYQFEIPSRSNTAGYEGKLIRVEDGLRVDPTWLSSGERVLMWLCLSMYAIDKGTAAEMPRLLLFDEPDSALHPHMIQKLHMVFERIVKTFNCGIIFTTHSPTSVALFSAGPIWQVSEKSIVQVDKDTAIADLLVGLDQISIHYTKCRQVYVESHQDEEVYTELFTYLRTWNIALSQHISLSFVPAAPKIPPANVRDLMRAHLGQVDPARAESFIRALNGQGNCAQVIGAVKSLNTGNGVPVHGIVDWDSTNRPSKRIHVLGQGIFYSLENAVLNPLTLGIYLLQNFRENIEASDFGLPDSFDLITVYSEFDSWQAIADGVTRRVLGVKEVIHEIDCEFLSGGRVRLDSRYSQMNGHCLEKQLRGPNAYPFLNAFNKRPTLLMDVLQRSVKLTKVRTMPSAFSNLFLEIQRES